MKNTSNEILEEFIQNVTEDFNEEDTSVGLYFTYKIDKDVVKDLEEHCEIKVISYKESEVLIQVAPTDTDGIKIYLNENGVWVGEIVRLLDEIFKTDIWKKIEKEL